MTSPAPEPRFWEPGAALHVGDRVRVRLSGECPDCSDYEHLNGVTGEVVECPFPDTEHNPGHMVPVRFTFPQAGRQFRIQGSCFARIELVRLADEASSIRVDQNALSVLLDGPGVTTLGIAINNVVERRTEK